MILPQAPIAASAVRDTIARIVTERGYQRSVSSTLFSRAFDWVNRVIRDLFAQVSQNRGTYAVLLTGLGLLVLLLLARAVLLARARRLVDEQRSSIVSAAELLTQARALAIQGAYFDGAHALYAALIARLEELRRVRRHPSKTIGDYWRELRSATDPLAPTFLAFAREYEVILYGDGLCDADRYARLERSAETIFAPNVDDSAQPDATLRAA